MKNGLSLYLSMLFSGIISPRESEKGTEMTTYTVAMATFYDSKWHIDRNTESVMMDATSVIEEGHKLAALGAVPFYTEYINDKRSSIMVEGPTGLEYAFLMV